jgi:hypothetical protein
MVGQLTAREWNVLDAATRDAPIPPRGRKTAQRLVGLGLMVLDGNDRMHATPDGVEYLGYASPALW